VPVFHASGLFNFIIVKLAQTLPNSRIWANPNEGKLNLPVIFYSKSFFGTQGPNDSLMIFVSVTGLAS
jgi:hypothetical protein